MQYCAQLTLSHPRFFPQLSQKSRDRGVPLAVLGLCSHRMAIMTRKILDNSSISDENWLIMRIGAELGVFKPPQ